MFNFKENCIIIGHLALGDQFIINGIIRYYSNIYNNVYIVSKKKYVKSIESIYNDNINIKIISVDTDNNILDYNHSIFKEKYNYDIIKIGLHNNNWYVNKSSLIIDNLPYNFYKTFYEQLNLDYYEIRKRYEKINRNVTEEELFYKKTMKNYNDKYIFIHDNLDNTIQNNIFKEIEYPIFHPNKNYYENNPYLNHLWNNSISNNILDYCKILENAEEIHVIFSSFLNLCMFLDLSKVKNKYLYTSLIYLKEFDENMKEWNIVYL